uniref:Uncharacterized protein n=1 Tax=Setaria italica TaxID=4555 RepID=K3XP32_SETIT
MNVSKRSCYACLSIIRGLLNHGCLASDRVQQIQLNLVARDGIVLYSIFILLSIYLLFMDYQQST